MAKNWSMFGKTALGYCRYDFDDGEIFKGAILKGVVRERFEDVWDTSLVTLTVSERTESLHVSLSPGRSPRISFLQNKKVK